MKHDYQPRFDQAMRDAGRTETFLTYWNFLTGFDITKFCGDQFENFYSRKESAKELIVEKFGAEFATMLQSMF
jgi:hypothetical protein